jgi:hypothetical protein
MRTTNIDYAPNMRLVAVRQRSVCDISQPYEVKRLYDDGYGPVWIYRDAGGLLGIVRAQTWEDAYGICEDVIFDDASEEDVVAYEHEQAQGKSLEGIGYRPNGTPSNDVGAWAKTPYYQEDLNGSSLNLLTAKLIEELRLTLVWADYNEDVA